MFDLYVVTDAGLSGGRSDAEVARLAYEGGADVVQLRMKDTDGKVMLEQANAIREVADEMCKLFIVNDRVDIAMASGADGVHLGQTDIPVEVARKLMGDDAFIGVSVDNAEQAVRAVCDALNWDGGLRVTICVPEGAALAKKTFNPQLGIEGGISILGTSGIVEPMSMQALIDTVALSLRQARAQGAARVLLTPGNYGVDFLREQGLDAAGAPVVKCSNFIGDALDEAAALGFADVLLVGHIGKLAKLAGGVMNTHSRYADCRTELLCAHAAVCGASQKTCAALLDAATTDACIALLDEAGLRAPVLDSLLRAVERHLVRRAAGAYRVGAVLFSNEYGLLGRTASAAEMLAEWKGKKQ